MSGVPAYADAMTNLYMGDAAEVLRGLPAGSVHLCVTSPPYWGGIRSYRGLGAEQLGHEATPGEPIPCTVLDPFSGSATTLIVARRLGRRSIGVELVSDYVELARQRLMAAQPGMSLGV